MIHFRYIRHMNTRSNFLQVTFDPRRTFAAAKAHIASNTPERGR